MKLLKIGSIIITIGLILSIIQSFYFGWNLKPITEIEMLTDELIKRIIYLGLAIYLIPLLNIYRKAVRKM